MQIACNHGYRSLLDAEREGAPALDRSVESGGPWTWKVSSPPPRDSPLGPGDPRDPAGCVKTTDCTPQPVTVWTRETGTPGVTLSSAQVGCLPPVAVALTWSVDLERPEGQVIFGISQSEEAGTEGACFADVEAVATLRVPCTSSRR